MSQHTPGPWQFGDTAGPNGIQVFRHDCKGFRNHVILAHRVNSEEDARLIAAAPDLYRELKHLVELMQAVEDSLNIPGLATLNGARAAIAKAKGE